MVYDHSSSSARECTKNLPLAISYCFSDKIVLSQGISQPSLSAFNCCTKTGLIEKASVMKSEAKFVQKTFGKGFQVKRTRKAGKEK